MKQVIAALDEQSYSKAVKNAAIWAAKQLNISLGLLHTLQKPISQGKTDYSGAIGLGARAALLEELAALDEKHSQVALELGKQLLEDALAYVSQAGITACEPILKHGSLVEAAQDLAATSQLLVVGRSQQKFKALGSRIENLVRQVPTPVLIPNQTFNLPQNFMLAYDGRDTTNKAVEKIINSGLFKGLTCHLVTVASNTPNLQESFAAVKERLENNGFQVESSFLTGKIAASLTSYQQEQAIDLVVMGAFSRSKLASIFVGSNTLKILDNTDVSLLILR